MSDTLDPRARFIPLDAAIAEAKKSGLLSIEELQALALSQPQAGEPVAWQVRGAEYDRAFTDEAEARVVAKGFGGAVIPLYTSPQPANPAQVTDGDPSARFARWLEEGPKLAKEAGCYVGIKVSDIQSKKVSRT